MAPLGLCNSIALFPTFYSTHPSSGLLLLLARHELMIIDASWSTSLEGLAAHEGAARVLPTCSADLQPELVRVSIAICEWAQSNCHHAEVHSLIARTETFVSVGRPGTWAALGTLASDTTSQSCSEHERTVIRARCNLL